MDNSPFRFGMLVGGEAFTNRIEEQLWIKQRFEAGTNTMLISPRRWGKSSLVEYVAKQVEKSNDKIIFVFIDLYNVRTEQEFYDVFAQQIIKSTSNGLEESLKSIKSFLKMVIPKLSINPDPTSEISVSFDFEEAKKNSSEILNLAETIATHKKKKIILCIDEFQNINFFDSKSSFQKKLRANWQKNKNVSFCLYGSKRHLLMDFFTKPSMPFYQFGDVLFLEKISEKYWVPFIVNHFKKTKKEIAKELALQIAHLMKNHPCFVQQFSQAVWFRTSKVCTAKIIQNALDNSLQQYSMLFQKNVDELSNTQLYFLKALCNNEVALSSAKILQKYQLGTSANIIKIKMALLDKEMINTNGSIIDIANPLFELWLKKCYFRITN
jgi:uncharacterized protein